MAQNVLTERCVLDLLDREGPMLGAQILEKVRGDALPLWRICRKSKRFHMEVVGRRYLRLDRVVEGFSRLSPSIRREFLTYTIIGTHEQAAQTKEQASRLWANITRISDAKIALAGTAMKECVDDLPERQDIYEHACFIIAGDVTYGMGHDVPRPERSTGQLVRGSDLDVIIVVGDAMPAALMERLDDAILKKKHYFLVHPDLREEVDYILKPLARVREQLQFDTFEHMVACKILDEGRFLLGSSVLYKQVKQLVKEHGVSDRIEGMTISAARNREKAERSLMDMEEGADDSAYIDLFYTREEGDEIY